MLLLSGGLSAQAFAGGTVTGVPRTLPSKSVPLAGHVPSLVAESKPLGAYTTSTRLAFSIALPLRNQALLDSLMARIYDPARINSPKHFITPANFASNFGPTQASYNAVIAYLKSYGMTITQTHPERTLIGVSGTASQVNAAFGVTINKYQAPDGRVFHAPDRDVSIPASLSSSIIGIIGLDDATAPQPLAVPLAATSNITGDVQNPGEQGTGVQGGFSPSDLKTAYGLSGLDPTINGAGQTIAMVEYGSAFTPKDILQYEYTYNLPRVPLAVVPVDGGVTTFGGASTETVLDIDMQIAMAPGASQILVYQGPNTNAATVDTIQQVATDDKAQQVSISYGFGKESQTRTTPNPLQVALNTVFTQMAAQGQSVYISSGDSGSSALRAGDTVAAVDILGSEPMVCCVGGTALVVQQAGVNEQYGAEQTWNYNNTAAGGAGGGGYSRLWSVPSYQTNAANYAAAITGSHVAASQRNIPDVSCVASPETGVSIYTSVDPSTSPGFVVEGGTSASAPLWAGYTALVNQNRARHGLGTLGLPNMSLYPLAYTSSGLTANYPSLFHDINDGSSNNTVSGGTNYAAVTGFDDSTGLGSFQGANLLIALSGTASVMTSPPTGGGVAMRPKNGSSAHLAAFVLPPASGRRPLFF